MSSDTCKYQLGEEHIPRAWYNIAADLPGLPPPLHPGTGKPIGPDDLAPLFPMALIAQAPASSRTAITTPAPSMRPWPNSHRWRRSSLAHACKRGGPAAAPRIALDFDQLLSSGRRGSGRKGMPSSASSRASSADASPWMARAALSL